MYVLCIHIHHIILNKMHGSLLRSHTHKKQTNFSAILFCTEDCIDHFDMLEIILKRLLWLSEMPFDLMMEKILDFYDAENIPNCVEHSCMFWGHVKWHHFHAQNCIDHIYMFAIILKYFSVILFCTQN